MSPREPERLIDVEIDGLGWSIQMTIDEADIIDHDAFVEYLSTPSIDMEFGGPAFGQAAVGDPVTVTIPQYEWQGTGRVGALTWDETNSWQVVLQVRRR